MAHIYLLKYLKYLLQMTKEAFRKSNQKAAELISGRRPKVWGVFDVARRSRTKSQTINDNEL